MENLDATAQAALVRKGEVTPLELVDAAIARIERGNPRLNAVVTETFERARDAARGPLPDGAFRGVPFLLKDLAGGAEAGVSLTLGSAFLRDHVSDHDTELVARFRRAGLVFVGRTNTPEFGIPPETEPVLFGPCKNPWNPAFSPGGSSGGAATAVAARFVPFAHASDAGGSIRIPASCCGVFGLKPSRGRNPMGPKLGESVGGFIADGCISISVRDSAALLDATGVPSLGDPYTAPGKARPYVDELRERPGRLRIAVMRTPTNGAAVHHDCLAALESAATLCRELGHDVVERSFVLSDLGEFLSAFLALWTTNAALNVAYAERLVGRTATETDFEPLTWALASMGRTRTAVEYVEAQRKLHRFSREIAAFFVDHDVVLSPVIADPPQPLGHFACTREDPLSGFMKAGLFAPFTPIYNVTGQPAMSVPLAWNGAGLPIGLQFAARYGDEATLFRLAAQLEEARPWADVHPPGSVATSRYATAARLLRLE